MIKYLLILLFLLQNTIYAEDYIYNFRENGLPSVRILKATGKVEVYSNLFSFTMTETRLKNLHKAFYVSLTYEIFLKRLKSKYPHFNDIQIEKKYRWLEYNEYLRIKELIKINPDKLF